ncbi:hypothetical protein MAMC_02176 [Methylacidimicrobium cyclopophantes]|uniref:Uncharacterized protein n=1 Tax=Methylacidimicrobium cyclopophantes TaxID=1041766 RepID=A0A5E6MQM2_9BACT|nr:hypothetical protein [Methylacidimicrobium cyclopophantes]VVM08461.1 hypothetical protein MAMC_02176 [Methylacidimicrobium cyclopophantes]
MTHSLLTHPAAAAPTGAQPELADWEAALFLPLLGAVVLGAFVWAGYRFLRREKEAPPAYAEFLEQDVAEEVDAEFEEGGR